jgi:hypothetical protein
MIDKEMFFLTVFDLSITDSGPFLGGLYIHTIEPPLEIPGEVIFDHRLSDTLLLFFELVQKQG